MPDGLVVSNFRRRSLLKELERKIGGIGILDAYGILYNFSKLLLEDMVPLR